jgi:hypothetical protein
MSFLAPVDLSAAATTADSPYRAAPEPVLAPGRVVRPRAAPYRWRELLAVVIVALGCDAWWWRARLGGYGGALLGVALLIALRVGGPARTGWRVTAPFELLVAAICARLAYDPGPLSFALLFGSVLALASARRGGSVAVTAVARSFFASVPALGSRVPAFLRGVGRVLGLRRLLARRSVAPLLVPLALALVFAGIFAFANPMVEGALAAAFTFLRERLFLPDPLRLFLLGVAALLASVLVRPVIRRRPSRATFFAATASATDPAAAGASDTQLSTARNSLLVLNLVFLAYNAVDVGYAARVLAVGTLPGGVTTQTYAHRGAFWLTVALALVTVVLGVLFRGSLAVDPRARTTRRLAAAWIAQSGVLALGTAFRLALHVHVSGISDLRFVGALGTALVAVGLALVGGKIRANLSFRWLLERQLGAFVAAVALYALVPTHFIAAEHNVPRLLAGDYGPLVHVRAEASEVESAALLVPLLHHEDPRVRQGVAVLLRREDAGLLGSWDDASHVSYAKVHATQELAAARPAIDDALAGICTEAADDILSQLVDSTVNGEAPPALAALPAAAAAPCHNRRGYED